MSETPEREFDSAEFDERERLSASAIHVFMSVVGNPVEDERDSGLKPNTIPL
jgi:hypothetical protein